MSVGVTDIFRAGTAQGAVARKASPLTALPTLPGAGVAGGGNQDIVSISDLARQLHAQQTAVDGGFVAKGAASTAREPSDKAAGLAGALSDEVAKIYSYLSDDAKKTLENGVASGKVSVKEVEEGLKYLANFEAFAVVQRTRTKSPEEIEAGNDVRELNKLIDSYGVEAGKISEKYRDLAVKQAAGEISQEDFAAQGAAIGAEETKLNNDGPYRDLFERSNAATEKAIRLGAEGFIKEIGGPPNEVAFQASYEKLDSIGFDVQRSNRLAVRAYVESRDKQFIFRADGA